MNSRHNPTRPPAQPPRPAAQPRAQTAHRPAPQAPPAYSPPRAPQVQMKSAPRPQPPAARGRAGAPAKPTAPNARPAPPAPNPKAAAAEQPRAVQQKRAAVAAPPPRPPKGPAGASPPKVNAVQLAASRAPRAGHAVARPAGAPRVIQALKLYPNLHPGAVERVEPGSLFRLESFTDQYRLRKEVGHGAYVPNQLYNFVRTAGGEMLLHNRYRHPSIAEGRQVIYAGEAFFNNGRLEWWSNGSGHYQPDADDAAQAALPIDQFYTYQQIIKGEHRRSPAGRG